MPEFKNSTNFLNYSVTIFLSVGRFKIAINYSFKIL